MSGEQHGVTTGAAAELNDVPVGLALALEGDERALVMEVLAGADGADAAGGKDVGILQLIDGRTHQVVAIPTARGQVEAILPILRRDDVWVESQATRTVRDVHERFDLIADLLDAGKHGDVCLLRHPPGQ
jgi:hypothetical protein